MKTAARAAIVLAVCACAGAVVWVFKGSSAGNAAVSNANVAGGIAAVLTLLVAVVVLWPRRQRARGGAADVVSTEQMVAATEYLAGETLRYWQAQAWDRRITTPAPAAVCWRWADEDVAPPPDDLGATGAELLTAGVITELREQLYARLPRDRARTVVLGGPGAGKTGAMLLLLIDVLAGRPVGSADPVPVWLTLGGWNPTTTPLLKWGAATLARDYPGVSAPEHGGPGAAAELLRAGRLALFLDGLDEMPPALQGAALEAIDRDGAGLPVVLTSRREEYRKALIQGRLYGAAVIDLLPLAPGDAAEFLVAEQLGEQRQAWRCVAQQLRNHPDGVAARTLTTPLALTLARDTYTISGDPRDLLDEDTYPNPDDLLRHLLARFLTRAYPDPKQRGHALDWLAWIAHHMGTNRDLAWWDIFYWIPERQVRVELGLVGGLVFGLVGGLVFGLVGGLVFGLVGGLVFGLVGGLGTGLVGGFALVAGLSTETASELSDEATGSRTLAVRRPTRREAATTLKAGLGAGEVSLLGGFLGLVVAKLMVSPKDRNGVLLVTGFGLGVGIFFVFGFMAGAVADLVRLWTRSLSDSPAVTPLDTYRAEWRFNFVIRVTLGLAEGSLLGVVMAIVGALVGAAAGHLIAGDAGAKAGVAIGIGVMLVYGAGAGIASVLGPAVNLKAAEANLFLRGQGRVRFMSLLETALQRQVLRQAGAVYQFRHAALQDHLAGRAAEAGQH